MTILHVDSSITGEASVSRQLTRQIVARLAAADPAATRVHRDLVANPLSHLTLGGASDEDVLDEFLAADTVVIGAPMYNFSVPTQLKAWIDRIAVNGRTFRYTEAGPEGLVTEKRVIIAVTRGGFYTPDHAMEHVESYLTALFGFLGIVPEFVHADGVNVARETGIAGALAEVEALAA